MKYLLLNTFIFLCLVASAQNDSDYIEIGNDRSQSPIETFQKADSHHGWVIAVRAHYGQIEKENALFGGVTLAYIMNHSLEIGLAGNGFYSMQDNNLLPNTDKLDLVGGYGGLHINPIIKPLKKVHIAFPILLGVGSVGYTDTSDRQGPFERNNDEFDEIFVGQIGANLVFNISRAFQVEVGINYLKTTDIELAQQPDLSIDGITGGFGFRFGRF